jgi:hypothetical protein
VINSQLNGDTPVPWQRLRGARPAVAERGAGAKRRRRGGEKGLWNSFEDKNFKRHFRLAAPAVRRTPQSIAARRGAAMRGLDMRLRMRYVEGSGVFRCEGLGAGRREKRGTLSVSPNSSSATTTWRMSVVDLKIVNQTGFTVLG